MDFHDLGDYWKCRQPPETIILDFGSLIFFRNIQNKSRKIPKYSWGQRFCEISKSQKSENRKRRVPENARDWSDKIWEILNMGSLYLEKHEMDMWWPLAKQLIA